MSKSDEEIENEILEKMSCDIYDCDVVDFNIEKDNNVQLTTVKLNNTAFNFLYDKKALIRQNQKSTRILTRTLTNQFCLRNTGQKTKTEMSSMTRN